MIHLLGTRGTIPVSGQEYVKFGGSSPSLMIPVNDDVCCIIDGGTGLFKINKYRNFKEFHIFFTHLHWDHIAGLPTFYPFYDENKKVYIYLEDKNSLDSKDFLRVLFNPPFFPVPRPMLKADIHINLISQGDRFNFDGLGIMAAKGVHPDGVLMYRITRNDKITLFATDYEHGTDVDDFLIEMAYKADYFIFDTTYLPDDYEGERDGIPKKGWGHSTYIEGARFAQKAKVKNLVLYHHNPDYDDILLEGMQMSAKKIFTPTICSYDGMVLD